MTSRYITFPFVWVLVSNLLSVMGAISIWLMSGTYFLLGFVWLGGAALIGLRLSQVRPAPHTALSLSGPDETDPVS